VVLPLPGTAQGANISYITGRVCEATSASVAKRQRAAVTTWHRDNPLDSARIIRIMRDNEQNGRRLTV